MYFSDTEYYSLVESIKDLNNFTALQQQSLNDNTKTLLSLNNSYLNNAQSILKLLLQGIGQKSHDRSEKILETDLRDCPDILETHFQNTLNQIQNKNQEIIDKLLICQQKIEFRAKRQKCLQKNASWELALKDEVDLIKKKAQQLNEAIQQHSIKIQHEERANLLPAKEQNENFEEESINLLKNLKDDYLKQLKLLQQSQKKIKHLNEVLE